ncbi:MAG: DNA polymerase/3'-5' exonuclease PolX, partial [Desulfobacteraceae bacterium]
MENARIAKLFNEIADLLELQGGNEFRVRSYRSAARTVDELPERLEDLVSRGEDPAGLPNIGKSTAGKIREILERGTCRTLEDLRKEVPAGLTELLRVPQLGPKKAALLYRSLGVGSLEELRSAAESGSIRDLPGMGVKTEENILRGLKTLESAAGRILYHTAAQYAAALGRLLENTGSVVKWEIAGSFRRGRETVGDLDILVQSNDREEVADLVEAHKTVAEVSARGDEKMSFRLESGLQVDLRFFEPESFGSALAYFTGSKAHNIALRKRAQAKGWKLNEYGLFKEERRLAGSTEESVYRRLGLPWIPPELREDRGEVEAADEDRLPELISLDQVRGDLHCHTSRTDGKNDLGEMAAEARNKGYSFLAVTEHSKAVSVAGGLNESDLKEHADHIRELDSETPDLWVMAGIEVDILKDGALDLDEKVLEELDWVVASVHSYFNMDRSRMTDRLLAAIKSGVVHCLGHPMARMIGSRDSVDFDLERVFDACREWGVFLEINAQPDRLDLPDIHVKMAKEAGCRFALSTDAHSVAELDFMRYGVMVARRGWLGPKET